MRRRSVDFFIGVCAAVGSAIGVLAGVAIGWPDVWAVVDAGLILAILGGATGVVAGAMLYFFSHVLTALSKGGQVPTDGPEADYHDWPRPGPPPDPRS